MKQSMFPILLAGLSGIAIAQSQIIHAPAEILSWSIQQFEGQTDYALVPAGDSGAPHAAVRAQCARGTASGRWLEQAVSLKDTPVLTWRWRVDRVYEGLDETTKAGDDYPARVYVVAERWPRFRSRAINYVWASEQPVGATWENAFSDAFMMVAVQSGGARAGEWIEERRDVARDFQQLHGLDVEAVDVVAFMTDCDNANQQATAWYGPISWRVRTESSAARAGRGPGHHEPAGHQRRTADRGGIGQRLDAGERGGVDREREQQRPGHE